MKTGRKIKVVVADVMARAEVREIDAGLDGMQRVIGGNIELFTVADGMDWWCDEDGLGRELPLNRIVLEHWPIVGPIMVTAADDDGNTISLTDAQAERALRHLNAECRIALHFERDAFFPES